VRSSELAQKKKKCRPHPQRRDVRCCRRDRELSSGRKKIKKKVKKNKALTLSAFMPDVVVGETEVREH